MIVSLTQGGRNIKGANFDGSKVINIDSLHKENYIQSYILSYIKLRN